MIDTPLKPTILNRILCNPWLTGFIGLFVFALDIATKYLISFYLPANTLGQGGLYPYGGVAIFKDFFGIEFSLVHATNRGAAWGVLSDFQGYLLIVRLLLVGILLAYLFFSNRHPERRIPMILIVAGALGNIFDYFFYGHVVDMFHFVLWGYNYPVFNVADSAIFVGIFWLLFSSYFDKSEQTAA